MKYQKNIKLKDGFDGVETWTDENGVEWNKTVE